MDRHHDKARALAHAEWSSRYGPVAQDRLLRSSLVGGRSIMGKLVKGRPTPEAVCNYGRRIWRKASLLGLGNPQTAELMNDLLKQPDGDIFSRGSKAQKALIELLRRSPDVLDDEPTLLERLKDVLKSHARQSDEQSKEATKIGRAIFTRRKGPALNFLEQADTRGLWAYATKCLTWRDLPRYIKDWKKAGGAGIRADAEREAFALTASEARTELRGLKPKDAALVWMTYILTPPGFTRLSLRTLERYLDLPGTLSANRIKPKRRA